MRIIDQETRLLEVILPEGMGELVPFVFRGDDFLGGGFFFMLECFSFDPTLEIDDLVGRTITVKVHDQQGGNQVFNGMVTRVGNGTDDFHPHRLYFLEIAPFLDLLREIKDCRVFQNQSVVDIFAQLCREQAFVDIDYSRLTMKYAERAYCIQYNETTYDFIHRLFEEAGIYYYYEHDEYQHTLVLTDQLSGLKKFPTPIKYREEAHATERVIHHWQQEQFLREKVVFFKDDEGNIKRGPNEKVMRIYRDPNRIGYEHGRIGYEDVDKKNQLRPWRFRRIADGKKVEDLRALQKEWPLNTYRAKCDVIGLDSGTRFMLSEHDDPAMVGEYYTVHVKHEVHDRTHLSQKILDVLNQHAHYSPDYYIPDYYTEDDSETEEEKQQRLLSHANVTQYYLNRITVLPICMDFALIEETVKPIVDAYQSAVVVGPPGKKIYTDSDGRVKIQFHWDRKGKFDEKSSCFVGVMREFGCQQWIPRIGDEVDVAFLEGNLDHPIVIGSVYNSQNREPLPLPENQNVSGIVTQTVDESSSEDQTGKGHRLLFDDTPGKECMTLHSEGDLTVNAKNNRIQTVGNNMTIQVKGNAVTQVMTGSSIFKAKRIHLVVGNSRVDIDENGVSFKPAGRLILKVKGGGELKPMARVGDDHQCPKMTALTPHKGGPVLKGSGFVKANGMAVARVGDPLHCRVETDTIKEGISNLTIDGIPVAKVGAKTEHGGKIVTGSPNVFIGESETSGPHYPEMMPILRQGYWISLNYPSPDKITLPDYHLQKAMSLSYETALGKESASAPLNAYAAGGVTLELADQITEASVTSTEIIAINDAPVTTIPVSQVKATNGDFQGVQSKDQHKKGPKTKDKILHATALFPPMIINLRKDKDHKPIKSQLTKAELAHIKNWGNNITIFIHGFNVALGQFPKQIAGVEMTTGIAAAGITPVEVPVPIVHPSSDDQTIYRDIDMLCKQYPEFQQGFNQLPPEVTDDKLLNGTEAHSWILSLEDNLNRATGQFDRSDYRKFTRCVHVMWPGDVGISNYLSSEDHADEAGKDLQQLIQQLANAKIKINIIAHSMGNRVLLKMMDLFGGEGHQDMIEHVFMCEAAVPMTALSNDLSKDISVKQNCHFIYAAKVAKKISVLYSDGDGVLKIDYPIGNLLVQDQDPERRARLIKYAESGGQNALGFEEAQMLKTIRPALGYKGPDKDTVTQLGERLISADTSRWIHSHSAMKNGTADIMKHVYRRWIMGGKDGMQQFGLYHLNKKAID